MWEGLELAMHLGVFRLDNRWGDEHSLGGLNSNRVVDLCGSREGERPRWTRAISRNSEASDRGKSRG